MKFARRVFTFAGVYGIVVLVPQYFMEAQIGRDYPPPITHPEHFYGFIGVALAWQIVFLMIGRDPVRYRMLMLAAIVEKLTWAVACIILYQQGRLALPVLGVGLIDLALGILFAISYRLTPSSA